MYTKVVILEGEALQFEKRSQQFQKGFQHLLIPDDAFGFLVTALPANNDIQFDRVFHNRNIVPSLDEEWHGVSATQHSGKKSKLATILDNRSLPYTIKASMHVKESPKTIGRPGVEFRYPLGMVGPNVWTTKWGK